jgi:hypothetical protein
MEAITRRVLSLLPLLSSAVLLIIVLNLLLQNVGEKELANVPYIGKDLGGFRKRQMQFMRDSKTLLRKGYQQVGL